MEVKFYELGEVDDSLFKYAVIVARYKGQWVWCKNKNRKWEVPGGRREENEVIVETAKRELAEETGAIEFHITPVCAYSVNNYGMLFFAEITKLGPLPESEIEKIDFFDDTPAELTFPQIQPKLIERVKFAIRSKS